MLTILLEAIIAKIVIPEVAAYMRRNPKATDADAIASYLANAPKRQKAIEEGRAFLAETGPTPT